MKTELHKTLEEHITITEEKDVSTAVSRAMKLAGTAGFKETEQFMIGTAVSELAMNIIKYAERGTIILDIIENERPEGMEVIAEDNGPGIEDVAVAMQDNFSTGGTLGIGLPGARRMMDEFIIESKKGQGTRIWARKWL